MIINPSASSVDWKSRMAANSALVGDHDLTTVETTKRDDATDLARQAAEDGFDVVVVLGGDGTLNEAANGLVGTNTALAALPGGSTNVFARTIGMAPKATRAAPQLAAALGRPDTMRTFGLGTVNGQRHFLFHLGHRLRRRGGGPGRAPGAAQAQDRPGHLRVLVVLDLLQALRPQAAELRPRLPGRHQRGGRLLHHLPQHQPLHLPGQTRHSP